jgi:hypothetical protein
MEHMASEKTPQYKRVKRAEEGREDWKAKALERREEIQRLTLELARKNERLLGLNLELKELKKKNTTVENKLTKQLTEMEYLKKTR